jgi:hypothetical protein
VILIKDRHSLEAARSAALGDFDRTVQLWPNTIIDIIDGNLGGVTLGPDWEAVLELDKNEVSITNVARLVTRTQYSHLEPRVTPESRRAIAIAMTADALNPRLTEFWFKRGTRPEWRARLWMARRMSDKTFLKQVAEEDGSKTVRAAATERLAEL